MKLVIYSISSVCPVRSSLFGGGLFVVEGKNKVMNHRSWFTGT